MSMEDSFDQDELLSGRTGNGGSSTSSFADVPTSHAISFSSEEEVVDTMPDVAIRLHALYESVATCRIFSSRELDNAHTCWLQAWRSGCIRAAASVISNSLCHLLTAPNLCLDTTNVLLDFFAKVAVRCNGSACSIPLALTSEQVFYALHSEMDYTRRRSCALIQKILEAADGLEEKQSRDSDVYQFSPEEDEIQLVHEVLPARIIERWVPRLFERVKDKCVDVRIQAVKTISLFPNREFETEENTTTPNKLVIRSLWSTSVEVRRQAINCVRFLPQTIEWEINECLDFLETEPEASLRHLVSARLITGVHLTIFTEKQRYRLLNLLENDSEGTVRALVARKLLPRWMYEADNLEYVEDESNAVVPFTYALLTYLNPLVNLSVANKTIMLGLSHFMERTVDSREDISGLLFKLNEADMEWREKNGWLDATTFPHAFVILRPRELYLSIYQLRCVADLICTVHRQQAGARHLALTYILPNMMRLAKMLREFACRWLGSAHERDAEEKKIAEFCIRQVFDLMNIVDRGCSLSVEYWRDSLLYIALSSEVAPSNYLVEIAMAEVLHKVADSPKAVEESVTAACYALGELLGAEPEYPEDQSFEEGSCVRDFGPQLSPIDPNLLGRVAIALFSMVRSSLVKDYNVLLKNIFDRIIGQLSSSLIDENRLLACQLIGCVSYKDEDCFHLHFNWLRCALQVDLQEIKVVALGSICDVAIHRGIGPAAIWASPEISTEQRLDMFKNVVEKAVDDVADSHTNEVILHCMRLILGAKVNWPSLLARIFIRSVLMAGFFKTLDMIELDGLENVAISRLSSFVVDNLFHGEPKKTLARRGRAKKAMEEVDENEESKQYSPLHNDWNRLRTIWLVGVLNRLSGARHVAAAVVLPAVSPYDLPPQHLSVVHALAQKTCQEMALNKGKVLSLNLHRFVVSTEKAAAVAGAKLTTKKSLASKMKGEVMDEDYLPWAVSKIEEGASGSSDRCLREKEKSSEPVMVKEEPMSVLQMDVKQEADAYWANDSVMIDESVYVDEDEEDETRQMAPSCPRNSTLFRPSNSNTQKTTKAAAQKRKTVTFGRQSSVSKRKKPVVFELSDDE